MDLSPPPSNLRKAASHRPGAHRRPRGKAAPASDRWPTKDPYSRSLRACGPRGELRYRLQYHQDGLYVEREEIPRGGLRCVQSMQFRDVRQFERWCDGDPARFEHPLLHLTLKRDAQALWQLGGPRDA